jgi:hypothetical protein
VSSFHQMIFSILVSLLAFAYAVPMIPNLPQNEIDEILNEEEPGRQFEAIPANIPMLLPQDLADILRRDPAPDNAAPEIQPLPIAYARPEIPENHVARLIQVNQANAAALARHNVFIRPLGARPDNHRVIAHYRMPLALNHPRLFRLPHAIPPPVAPPARVRRRPLGPATPEKVDKRRRIADDDDVQDLRRRNAEALRPYFEDLAGVLSMPPGSSDLDILQSTVEHVARQLQWVPDLQASAEEPEFMRTVSMYEILYQMLGISTIRPRIQVLEKALGLLRINRSRSS